MKERIWRSDQPVGSYQKVAPSPVLSMPHTWKIENEDVIQDLWRQGIRRDENGAPIPQPATPATPAAPAAAPVPTQTSGSR